MSATTIAPPINASTPALSEFDSLVRQIDRDRMPRHIAMICDGNGRWASKRGLPRPFGHRQGYIATRKIVRAASDLGLEALTLYAFSTENWTRPKTETDALMRLFEEGARRELRELHENGVRMRFSGRISELPESLQARLRENEELTRNNPGLTLNICLNYSGRDEILRAADFRQRAVLVEQILQRDRVGDLAALDQLADRFVDATVQRIGKMLGPQELVDPVEDEVVGQNRAEQCLLGVIVDRRCALRHDRIAAPQPRDVV